MEAACAEEIVVALPSIEGWWQPSNSRFPHYARGSMSLCRRYMFLGRRTKLEKTAPQGSCRECCSSLG